MQDLTNKVRKFCEVEFGINSETMSVSTWKKIIHERMHHCSISQPNDYWNFLQSSPEEYQALVEAVVVTESWFFRDQAAIDFLVPFIKRQTHRVRILSIPCASGEEPYSIAMTLVDSGIDPDCFHIEGIDISQIALSKAKQAIYGKNSFRGDKQKHLLAHFSKEDECYALHRDIKNLVTFNYANVCSSAFLSFPPIADVIFCRNLLIYLNKKAQVDLLTAFAHALGNDGILIVSPAEADLCRKLGWVKSPQPKLFIFQRHAVEHSKRAPVIKAIVREIPQKTSIAAKELKGLEVIQKLADEGTFQEAWKLLEKFLGREGLADPDAYFLAGVIKHACLQEELAEKYFLKALYLKPDFVEALTYLALLAERRGDDHQAQLFRSRLERSEKYVHSE